MHQINKPKHSAKIYMSPKPEDFELTSRVGSVVDVQLWNETKVAATATGGGSYLTNGSGTISPISMKIRNSNTQRGRAFVKWETGDESEIALSEKFTARVGHRILERKLQFHEMTWPVSYSNLDLRTVRNIEYNPPKEKATLFKYAAAGFFVGIIALVCLLFNVRNGNLLIASLPLPLIGAIVGGTFASRLPSYKEDQENLDIQKAAYQMIFVASKDPIDFLDESTW